jgi:hypothetical protein
LSRDATHFPRDRREEGHRPRAVDAARCHHHAGRIVRQTPFVGVGASIGKALL